MPKTLPLTTLQKVLQNLLDEGVPIRDMRTILEALSEHAPKITDAHDLTAAVRLALGRAITQQWYPGTGDMQVMGLDSKLERVLSQALSTGPNPGLEPGLAHTLLNETQKAMMRQQNLGLAAGAARAARVAADARALPAPQPAAVEGAVVCGSARHAQRQGGESDRRARLTRVLGSVTAIGASASAYPQLAIDVHLPAPHWAPVFISRA